MQKTDTFRRRKIGGIKWIYRRDYECDSLMEILKDPDGAFAAGETLPICSVSKISVGSSGKFLMLKRYARRKRNRFCLWKYFLRKSKALHAFEMASLFASVDIATATPVAAGEEKFLGFFKRGYLVTEELQGYTRLDEALRIPLSRKGKQNLIEAMAYFLRKLHKAGLGCRDLKLQNIFVKETSEKNFAVNLIDLDMVRLKKHLGRRRRIQNIARLNAAVRGGGHITNRDRLRFLRSYLGAEFENKEILRIWWKKTIKRTERKLKKSLLAARYS